MRLEEWQKYLDAQFVDEVPAANPVINRSPQSTLTPIQAEIYPHPNGSESRTNVPVTSAPEASAEMRIGAFSVLMPVSGHSRMATS